MYYDIVCNKKLSKCFESVLKKRKMSGSRKIEFQNIDIIINYKKNLPGKEKSN